MNMYKNLFSVLMNTTDCLQFWRQIFSSSPFVFGKLKTTDWVNGENNLIYISHPLIISLNA